MASRRSTTIVAIVAHAKAAKICLTFTKMERRLKLEKARLEASMNVLTIEMETVVAIGKAEVLEAAT